MNSSEIGTGYYDLSRSPPSFNVIDSILQFEKWRNATGLKRLRIVVLPGPLEGFRRDNLPPSGGKERTKWLNNIVLPFPKLLPSCGQEATIGKVEPGPSIGHGEYLVGFRSLLQMARENIYPLRAPSDEVAKQFAKYGDRYVTITLRDTGWWVKRTTNVAVWKTVAAALQGQGYRAVFVPDGTKPDTVIEGFSTDRDASLNSFSRAALYQGATMNFGIPCGPLWMAWFQGAPVMMVKMINEGEPSTSAANYTAAGLPPGSQIANAKPRQRLIWQPEDAGIVLAEFERLMA